MSSDITRKTFRKKKHYRRVVEQQGRGHLDSEHNEQVDILHHYRDTAQIDLIGQSGTPLSNPGFKIDPVASGALVGSDYTIGKGHYYVDGRLCENKCEINASRQGKRDLPLNGEHEDIALPQINGLYLTYLDVWERDISCVDDEKILEPALGGISTTTRTKLIWQVKVLKIPTHERNILSQIDSVRAQRDYLRQYLLSRVNNKTGRLEAQVEESTIEARECEIPPFVGYSGLDNFLYRVEIHSLTSEGIRYKWSRYNKHGVAKFDIEGTKINLEFLDENSKAVFKEAGWVELTDDLYELHGKSGFLYKIHTKNIEENHVTVIDETTSDCELSSAILALVTSRERAIKKCLAWDGVCKFDYGSDFKELELGVQIKFNGSSDDYKPGDYWLIPARSISRNILWPTRVDGQDEIPIPLLPDGIKHHYALLALLNREDELDVESDLRNFFSNLTEIPKLFYAGGDGQTGKPGERLSFPLKARTFTPEDPEQTLFVKLSIEEGEGTLNGSSPSVNIQVINGFVECAWTLGKNALHQKVKAVLLDEFLHEMQDSELFYNAHLDYPNLYYVGGDGQNGKPGKYLVMPLQVGVFIGREPYDELKVKYIHGDGAEAIRDVVNGYASYTWQLAESPETQYVEAQLYHEGHDGPIGNKIRFHATLEKKITPAMANTGLIRLGGAQTIFGPFKHYLQNISKPPAIILGLEKDVVQGYHLPIRPAVVPEISRARASMRISLPKKYATEILEAYNVLPESEKVEIRDELGDGLIELDNWVKEHSEGDLESEHETELIQILDHFKEVDLDRWKILPRVISKVLFMEDYNLTLKNNYPDFKAIWITLTDFSIELDSSLKSNELKSLDIRWWAIPANEQEDQISMPETVTIGMLTADDSLFMMRSVSEIAKLGINHYCSVNNIDYRFDFLLESTQGQSAIALEKVQSFKAIDIELVVANLHSGYHPILSYINENSMACIDAINTMPELALLDDSLYRMCPSSVLQGYSLAENLWSWGIKACIVIRQDSPSMNIIYDAFVQRFESKGGTIHAEISLPDNVSELSSFANMLSVNIQDSASTYGFHKVGVQVLTSRNIPQLLGIFNDYPVLADVTWFGTEDLANDTSIFQNHANIVNKIKLISPSPAIAQTSMIYKEFERTSRIAIADSLQMLVPFYNALLVYDSCWVMAKSVIAAGSSEGENVNPKIIPTSSSHLGTTGMCILDDYGDRVNMDYDVWDYKLKSGSLIAQKVGYYTKMNDKTAWLIQKRPIIFDSIGLPTYTEVLEHYTEKKKEDPSYTPEIEENSTIVLYIEDKGASLSDEPNTIEFNLKRRGQNTRGTTVVATETGNNTGKFKADISMTTKGNFRIGKARRRLTVGDPILELTYTKKDGDIVESRLLMRER